MTDFADIAYHVSDRVARIVIARPERLNAFRDQTADEIRTALSLAEEDPAVRCMVLTGKGRAFSAGYDLTAIKPDQTPELGRVLEQHFNPLITQMRQSRLAIVAAVNGPCAGAAVGIALAADIVLAARSAYFYEPFLGIALVPDAGNTQFLARILGRVRASGMMLLGDRITAAEACAWGLVWRVLEPDTLGEEVERVAVRLAALSPTAVAATKRLIHSASESGLADQLSSERDLQDEIGRSPDVKVAIEGFFKSRREASG